MSGLTLSDTTKVRPIEHPIEVWSQVHDWLDAACDSDNSLIAAADLFEHILRRNATLWCVWRRDKLVGAFVTKIQCGTRGKALEVVALGGEEMPAWIESFDAAISDYAREHRCRFLFEMGREGWVRVLDKLGWAPGPATMLKVI